MSVEEKGGYYPYCNDPRRRGLTCDQADLILVCELPTQSDDEAETEGRIYRCTRCNGFYKRVSESSWQMSDYPYERNDRSWQFWDTYYKVEEWDGSGVRFPLEEARSYGYTGEDFMMSGGRCIYPKSRRGLTCLYRNLARIARADDPAAELKKCRKCGQLYKQVREPSGYYYYKPGMEYDGTVRFPIDEARQYGNAE